MKSDYKIYRLKLKLRALWRHPLNAEKRKAYRKARKSEYLAWEAPLLRSGSIYRVGIITTRHTQFVGHLLSKHLSSLNFRTFQMPEYSGEDDCDLYFVVCPQMFEHLPPPSKTIAFQMEQSVSSRWFTAKYIDILRSCLAVAEYSMVNISALDKFGISHPQLFYIPLGPIDNYSSFLGEEGFDIAKKYDVLFYGDDKVDRRRKILDALAKEFRIHILNDTFGKDLRDAVRASKVVVNIHYYEGALLESTRIFEALSLGCQVVSEVGFDQEDYPELNERVRFVEPGDVEALIVNIREALRGFSHADVSSRNNAISAEETNFRFHLTRLLLAMRIISYDVFWDANEAYRLPSARLALSLPETFRRRAEFRRTHPDDFAFDGLRAVPAWVGCALSYKFLAAKALQQNFKMLTVFEDDAVFRNQREGDLECIMRHLEEVDWDFFCGLIADLHQDTKVVQVTSIDGLTLVTLDRMVSMVYNIYSKRALQILSKWDPSNGDVSINTIDRFIERQQSLRVVTVVPFIVDHRDDSVSTLWSFSNAQYRTLIDKSEALLREKIADFSEMSGVNTEEADG
ncbi:methyltransferase type 11 [Hyphomicrobium sp. DY-1]|uniref:methyltransferase type 11 n=1 Tax=Hyphomicrobium sp. DY-1 TaxID=3075650 RepID=UPI0039C079B2